MQSRTFRRVGRALALFAAMAWPGVGGAETLIGTNIEDRVVVGIAAAPDAVQALLPEGWISVPVPAGPVAGANVMLVFIDTRLSLDAEGQPTDPASRRTATLVGLGRAAEGATVRLFVLQTYTTAPELDPFGNAVRAGIARESALTGPADGGRISEDFWRVVPEGDGPISLRLNRTTGRTGWSSGESAPYSITDPELVKLFRYDQMVEVVMSKAMGKPLSADLTLTSRNLSLADVFDGSEEVVAVLSLPVYIRRVFEP